MIKRIFTLIFVSSVAVSLFASKETSSKPAESNIVVSNSTTSIVKTSATESAYVVVCGGPHSKRYHSHKNCRGLNKCSAKIKEIPLSDAKRRYTPCQICY